MTTPTSQPTSERTVRTSSRKGLADSALGTRNLMVIAALSVVGLILVIPLTYLSPSTIASERLIWIGCALMSLWVIPFLLPATVVRRPGAVIIASLIIGIVSVFTTPAGPSAVIGNLIGGALIEIPLALFLYRKWTWWSFAVAASVFGLVNGVMYVSVLQATVGLSVTGPMIVVAVVSSLVGAAITMGLTYLLNRAGVGVDRSARS